MWVERRGLGQVGLRALRASEREGAPLDRFFLGVPSRGGREPTQPRAQGPGPRQPRGPAEPERGGTPGTCCSSRCPQGGARGPRRPRCALPRRQEQARRWGGGGAGRYPAPPPRTASTPRTGFVLWAPGARARSFWPGETSRPLQFGARAGRPPRHQVRGMKPP